MTIFGQKGRAQEKQTLTNIEWSVFSYLQLVSKMYVPFNCLKEKEDDVYTSKSPAWRIWKATLKERVEPLLHLPRWFKGDWQTTDPESCWPDLPFWAKKRSDKRSERDRLRWWSLKTCFLLLDLHCWEKSVSSLMMILWTQAAESEGEIFGLKSQKQFNHWQYKFWFMSTGHKLCAATVLHDFNISAVTETHPQTSQSCWFCRIFHIWIDHSWTRAADCNSQQCRNSQIIIHLISQDNHNIQHTLCLLVSCIETLFLFQETKQESFSFQFLLWCHFCLLLYWNETLFWTCQLKSNEALLT